MKDAEKTFRKRARAAKLQIWLATSASRNRTLLDRALQLVIRRLLDKALYIEPENDFMKDDLIDTDTGYDPEELERYQRGDS
ncbi:MAG: hypothetical protein VCD00_00490 [Candidatus Hydrogenedentota bacterium]